MCLPQTRQTVKSPVPPAHRDLVLDVLSKQAGHGHRTQTVYKIATPLAIAAANSRDVEAVEGGCDVEREDSNE